jgi:hypothetical protein
MGLHIADAADAVISERGEDLVVDDAAQHTMRHRKVVARWENI